MGKLFISHSSKDKVIADALAGRVKALGYDYFLDFQGIRGGAAWEKEIYDAMRQSVAVLVCATAAAMESRWVFAEMLLARYSGIPLIPLIMQECALPEMISATTQHIDFKTDPEAGYSKLWASLEQLKVTPSGPEWPPDKSPYPGLLALQEEHARVFFGRARELNAAIAFLRPGGRQQRFLAIVGPSGSGKSSLVRAGLIPALKRGAITGSDHWLYVRPFTPGEAPFRNLAGRLRECDKDLGNARDIEQRLREVDGLLYLLMDLRADARAGDRAQVVVTLDQLEEIERRTLHSEAVKFLKRLHEALRAPDTPLLVLATLRADFVAPCLQFPELASLLQSGTQLLGVMDRPALREAISGPAKVARVRYDDDLIERILDETSGGDALPLMAHALERLWLDLPRTGERLITKQAYQDIGGVTGALAQRAQQVFDETPTAEQEALRRALVQLADVNDRGDFTRRRVRREILPSDAQPALDRLIDARLLVTSGDAAGIVHLEVAHEALLRNWPLLCGWLEAESETLRLRRDIEQAAQDWDKHGRSGAYLWRDERLATALACATTQRWSENDLRHLFLEAGRTHDRVALERAHEANKNIAYIRNWAYLLNEEASLSDEGRRYTQKIDDSAHDLGETLKGAVD